MNPFDAYCQDIATIIRQRVAACAPDLSEADRIDVVVWNEEDLLTLAEAATAKAKGLAVIVSGIGGENPDPASNDLKMGGRFSVSVWRNAIIVGDLTAKELCWQCALATHDLEVGAGPNHLARRLAISEIALRTVPNFLIWEALGKVTRLKSDPQPAINWEDIWTNWEDIATAWEKP